MHKLSSNFSNLLKIKFFNIKKYTLPHANFQKQELKNYLLMSMSFGNLFIILKKTFIPLKKKKISN
jgi:hypothetical protein